MKVDYEKLGLRVGFEIHQELNTHKLFCGCPSSLREEEAELKVKRRLRPTQSELGEVDRAALAEALKGKGFRYHVYPDSTCLVELDEEPPHPLNEEALDIALEVSLLLHARPVDEAHTMRKIVIDGSNTCGFQRTTLIATDGYVDTARGRVRISTICLEEDAARKVDEDPKLVDYSLDRLGIPLVEIATGPDFNDPYTPAEVALYLGQVLRATGKVKRGIGTIRQDINISIQGGGRQEIKGVQELGLISAVIEREVQRQVTLLEIKEELRRRGAPRAKPEFLEVTEIFASTKSKTLGKAIREGGVVLALKLERFGGLLGRELQPGRRFGTELASHAKTYGGVGGLFHTDELPSHGVTKTEVEELKRKLRAGPQDAVVLVAGPRAKAEEALKAVVNRANQALEGVPEETRRALPDGNTEFMRPLPGAARMYVETDIPPIPITQARLERIKRGLPELPEQKLERFRRKYGLSLELAKRLSVSERVELFETLVKRTRADPTLIASTLEETLVSLRREGIGVENIQEEAFEELFTLVGEKQLAKEAIPDVLKLMAKGKRVKEAVRELGLEGIPEVKLLELISKVLANRAKLVRERGKDALKPLMGEVMAKVRGRVDGELVYRLLKRELERVAGTG